MNKQNFQELLAKLQEIKKRDDAIREAKILDTNSVGGFDNDDLHFYITIKDGTKYIFDTASLPLVTSLCKGKELRKNKDGYLCLVKDNKLYSFHRQLKLEEVRELVNKMHCSETEIHVHHKDEDKKNNCLSNLEVVHKEEHARYGGHSTWAKYRKNNFVSDQLIEEEIENDLEQEIDYSKPNELSEDFEDDDWEQGIETIKSNEQFEDFADDDSKSLF
jgi:hypothetical protein